MTKSRGRHTLKPAFTQVSLGVEAMLFQAQAGERDLRIQATPYFPFPQSYSFDCHSVQASGSFRRMIDACCPYPRLPA